MNVTPTSLPHIEQVEDLEILQFTSQTSWSQVYAATLSIYILPEEAVNGLSPPRFLQLKSSTAFHIARWSIRHCFYKVRCQGDSKLYSTPQCHEFRLLSLVSQTYAWKVLSFTIKETPILLLSSTARVQLALYRGSLTIYESSQSPSINLSTL